MDNIAIKVDKVSKTFKLPHEKHTSVKSVFINFLRNSSTYERQQVLGGVNFEIKKGEFIGIIGRNGNGKSTMLKMLAGIYAPDSGHIQVNGKLTPFIELGVGFNPELTGRENVFLNGALLGFSQKEMEGMYADIVEFAELERFMDQKLKNYSSGMQVRLAFSIAIQAKSDILLIDEVLAVGDVNFQKKCIGVFEELKRSGRTIVFVSHSMGYIKDFCDRVIVINDGTVAFDGSTLKAVDIYNKLNADEEDIRLAKQEVPKVSTRMGNGKATITKTVLVGVNDGTLGSLVSGKKFKAEIDIQVHEEVPNCAVGLMFRKNPQENLYGINTYQHKSKVTKLTAGEKLKVTIEDTMPLNPGTYYVSYAVASMSGSSYEDVDNQDNIKKINVTGPEEHWGLINSSPVINFHKD